MSGVLDTFDKQPVEVLDFDVNYAEWLANKGDTIAAITVTVETGLTVGDGTNGAPAPSHSNGVVKAWFVGGVDGQSYKATYLVTTGAGRIKSAEILIRVKEV